MIGTTTLGSVGGFSNAGFARTVASPMTTGYAAPMTYGTSTIAAPTTISRPATTYATTVAAPTTAVARPATTYARPATTAVAAPTTAVVAAPAPVRMAAPVISAPTQPYKEQLPTGVVTIEAEKYDIPVDCTVTWKFFDDDIPQGTQGTVIGFPEDDKDKRVRVKFPRDFWDLKAEELEKVSYVTTQYTTQYASPIYVDQGYVDGGVIYADGGLVAPTTYLETVEPTVYMETVAPTTYMETVAPTTYVDEGGYIMDGGFVAPTMYAEPAIYTQY